MKSAIIKDSKSIKKSLKSKYRQLSDGLIREILNLA